MPGSQSRLQSSANTHFLVLYIKVCILLIARDDLLLRPISIPTARFCHCLPCLTPSRTTVFNCTNVLARCTFGVFVIDGLSAALLNVLRSRYSSKTRSSPPKSVRDGKREAGELV